MHFAARSITSDVFQKVDVTVDDDHATQWLGLDGQPSLVADVPHKLYDRLHTVDAHFNALVRLHEGRGEHAVVHRLFLRLLVLSRGGGKGVSKDKDNHDRNAQNVRTSVSSQTLASAESFSAAFFKFWNSVSVKNGVKGAMILHRVISVK